MLDKTTLVAIWASAVVGALASDAIKGKVNTMLGDETLGKFVTAALAALVGLILIMLLASLLKL